MRDIYAFYPLLIKYVDQQRNHWLKNNVIEAEDLYNHVADIFNIWSKSQVLSFLSRIIISLLSSWLSYRDRQWYFSVGLYHFMMFYHKTKQISYFLYAPNFSPNILFFSFSLMVCLITCTEIIVHNYYYKPDRKPGDLKKCICCSISCVRSRILYLPMRLTTWCSSCLQQLADQLLFLKVDQLGEAVR